MAPGARQRDVHPLPASAADARADARHGRRGRQRAPRGAAWRRWANDGIATLNQLSGHSSASSAPPGLAALAAQASAAKHVAQTCRDFPVPLGYHEHHHSGEAALAGVLASAPGHSTDSRR
eukprot:9500867-Pyramimonas_sp.AAC.1